MTEELNVGVVNGMRLARIVKLLDQEDLQALLTDCGWLAELYTARTKKHQGSGGPKQVRVKLAKDMKVLLAEMWCSSSSYEGELGYLDEVDGFLVTGSKIDYIQQRELDRLLKQLEEEMDAVRVHRFESQEESEQFVWTDKGRALFVHFDISPELRGASNMPKAKVKAAEEDTPKAKKGKAETNGHTKPKKIKAEAERDPEREAAHKADLSLIHYRLLKTLQKAGQSLTYNELSDQCEKACGVRYYPMLTAQLRVEKEGSLGEKGLVKEVEEDRDGKTKLCFAITAAGRKALEKAAK